MAKFAHQSVYKASDSTITNNTTPSNDADLCFDVEPNEHWSVEIFGTYDGIYGGFKYQFSGPSSPTLISLNDIGSLLYIGGTNSAINSYGSPFGQSGGPNLLYVKGVILNGSNRGTVNFQWSQNSSDAHATTLYAGTYLIATKLN